MSSHGTCPTTAPPRLADDLIEPLRPLVDDRARELYRQGYDELTTEAKAGLLRLLAEDVRLREETGPFMVQLHRFVASLVKCFEGTAKELAIPVAMNQPSADGSATAEPALVAAADC
jgi:hypothetical protein